MLYPRSGCRVRFHRSPLSLLPFVCLATLLGCSEATVEADQVVRRDSSGVQLVETRFATWSAATAWSVAPEPELLIGVVEGQQAYLFGSIVGVRGLEDGTIAVADGQANSIRIFDEHGQFLREFGRSGEGPGEFSVLYTLRECEPGKIYAEDRLRSRISVWSPEGVLEREFTLHEPGSERGPYKAECSASGEFLIAGWGEQQLPRASETPVFAQTAPVWLVDTEGQTIISLGEHMVSERVAVINERTGGGSIGPHPFGRALSYALDGERMYLGGDRLEVIIYDRTGSVVEIFRGPAENWRTPEDILDQYAAEELSPPVRAMIEVLRNLETPLTAGLPAIADVKLDPDGNVWVKRFQFPWEVDTRWGVFEASGAFLGHIHLPDHFTLHEIERTRLLGVHRDDLGVERVAVYALIQPSGM